MFPDLFPSLMNSYRHRECRHEGSGPGSIYICSTHTWHDDPLNNIIYNYVGRGKMGWEVGEGWGCGGGKVRGRGRWEVGGWRRRQTGRGRVGGGGEGDTVKDTDREEEVMFWFVHTLTRTHTNWDLEEINHVAPPGTETWHNGWQLVTGAGDGSVSCVVLWWSTSHVGDMCWMGMYNLRRSGNDEILLS